MLGPISTILIILLLSSLIVYLIGKIAGKSGDVHKESRVLGVITIAINVVFLGIVGYMLMNFDYGYLSYNEAFQFEEKIAWIPDASIYYHVGVDGISLLMLLLTAIVAIVVAWFSMYEIHHNVKEYYSALLLFEVGIVGTFTALDLVVFYVFWELVLVPMFFLIGEWGPNRERARYSAIKFFIYTHVGSVLMLAGFSLAYIQLGTFDFVEIANASVNIARSIQTIIVALIFFGFAFKLPVVPFHTWLPDAHVEAPSPVSVLLAGLLLKMAGYGFIRVMWMFPLGFDALGFVFLVLSTISIIYSAVVGIRQDDLKRMIAYSSINHMGYVLFALGAITFMDGNANSIVYASYALFGAVVEMFAHGVIIGMMFLLSGIILEKTGTRDVNVLRGLAHKMKKTATLFVLGAMASGGFPGMVGFVGELTIFFGGLSLVLGKHPVFFVVLFGPLIVIAYLLWAIQRVFFQELNREDVEDATLGELMPIVVLMVITVVFGVYPYPLNKMLESSIKFVLGSA